MSKLVSFFLILGIFTITVLATTNNHLFLIKSVHGNGYIWQWYQETPEIINEMCWNNEQGFNCDSRMQNRSIWIYEIFDVSRGLNGSIYRIQNDCYVFWWEYDREENGTPHVKSAYWIICPEIE